jgi:hypothetical protein
MKSWPKVLGFPFESLPVFIPRGEENWKKRRGVIVLLCAAVKTMHQPCKPPISKFAAPCYVV